MSMEKRGVVDSSTPPEKPAEKKCCGGQCHAEPRTKEAADAQQEHVTTRLTDAAADAFRK